MADRQSSASSSRRSRPAESTVGDFEVGAEIGKGSFAQVYQGQHRVRTCTSSTHASTLLLSRRSSWPLCAAKLLLSI